VSCTSATNCTAVGQYTVGPDESLPLAENWNGSHWSGQTVPGPAGSTFSFLNSVACPSATSCTAVGFSVNSANDYQDLAEQWDGSSWSVQAVSNPAGQPDAALYGVACSSATSCTAVGVTNSLAVAAQWNGTAWSVQTITPPAGQSSARLDAISCPSAANCTAVGQSAGGPIKNRALAERWDGTTWSRQETAQPTAHQSLTAISCRASRTCTAVGTSGPAQEEQLLAERE
jgi:hypothetical protein